ncbi:hypothetical protein GLYMA_17G249800v4 [Glycine max]|uniref:Uncharacterized protein n=1 Tax=Glycine max TaxID=3847 RepID=K7MNU7_SOYBN|nr:hypothetical protein GYH30_048414 [Glycine max]KHN12718.1 hypothetical protein glysoja_008681 [Glycine soja]KRH05804.1 hypothetical protein GLYMA_17G249800v4 [Glycine max]
MAKAKLQGGRDSTRSCGGCDVRSVRDAAVSEIAKMSLHSLPLHHLKSHSIVQNIMGSRKMKQAESSMDTTIDNNQ